MPRLTRSTRLTDLQSSVVFKLRSFLDPNEKWKELAEAIQNRQGEEKYSRQDLINFGMELQKGRSPTEALIQDWSYDNVSLLSLLKALAEIQRYDVLRWLLVEKLKDMTDDEFDEQADEGWEGCFERKPTRYVVNKRAVEDATATAASAQNDYVFETYESGGRSYGAGNVYAHPNPSQYDAHPNPSQYDAMKEVETAVLPDGSYNMQASSVSVTQYRYSDLYQLTDHFNNRPLSEGGRKLGDGGYATVYLAEPPQQRRMAVKVLKDKENAHKQFLQEVDALVKFAHNNIVPLFGVSQDGPQWCIVYEYMENGSLEDRLACKDGTAPLTGTYRSRIAKDIAQGLNFLHTKNRLTFVHRDIKPANVLLDYDYSAKIGDCGLAHRGPLDAAHTHTSTRQLIGTQAYCAPEYFYNEISVKLDAYSFGIVLYEMLSGLPAHDDCREEPRLNKHVEKCFEEHDATNSLKILMDVRLAGWKAENVTPVFDVARRLTIEDKSRRAKVEEVLHEILEWPQEW